MVIYSPDKATFFSGFFSNLMWVVKLSHLFDEINVFCIKQSFEQPTPSSYHEAYIIPLLHYIKIRIPL